MEIPKISVIVPIYNVEPYLRRCLDSLVNQTLKDIEIICINDCSPDNSLAILKEYARKDERMKIIDFDKNQGVSAARNAGMKIAKGEYFAFVDPDDYVDLDFYEKLHKLAKDKNADIAKAVRKKRGFDSDIELIEDENMNERIRRHKCHFFGQFQTAIFRSKMLKKHNVVFPANIITSQDGCFTVRAVIAAKNLCFLDNTFYHYVKREGSLCSKTHNQRKAYSYLRSHFLMLNRIVKAMEEDKHYFHLYKLIFQNILEELRKNSEKQTIKKIAELAIKYYQKCRFAKKLDLPKNIKKNLKDKNKIELVNELKLWKEQYDLYPEIRINNSVLQNRKLYIWGTGEMGVGAKNRCEQNGWKITGFLDSAKKYKEFYGYKVKKPEYVLKGKKDFFIIISSKAYRYDIAKICEKAGLKTGKDFWKSC